MGRPWCRRVIRGTAGIRSRVQGAHGQVRQRPWQESTPASHTCISRDMCSAACEGQLVDDTRPATNKPPNVAIPRHIRCIFRDTPPQAHPHRLPRSVMLCRPASPHPQPESMCARTRSKGAEPLRLVNVATHAHVIAAIASHAQAITRHGEFRAPAWRQRGCGNRGAQGAVWHAIPTSWLGCLGCLQASYQAWGRHVSPHHHWRRG
jgi:hypothetical protein